MIPTFSPVPIKVPIVSKISVNEKARIAIKTPGKRDTSEKSDPKPLEPSAAPKTLPRSLNDDDKLAACQSIAPRSTTPAKIAMIVVARIERRTPPRIPLTIKIIAITRPIKPTITVGLLKATKPGVAADEAVMEALAISAPLPATV